METSPQSFRNKIHRTWTPSRLPSPAYNSRGQSSASANPVDRIPRITRIFPALLGKPDDSEGRSPMAPGMASPYLAFGKLGLGLGLKPAAAEEVEELRRRNEELEREVRERRTREEEMRRELERTKARLRVVEEAEEQLCFQLGEIEAEAVAQARDYRRRIKALSDELEEARRILGSSSFVSPSTSHSRLLVGVDGSI